MHGPLEVVPSENRLIVHKEYGSGIRLYYKGGRSLGVVQTPLLEIGRALKTV